MTRPRRKPAVPAVPKPLGPTREAMRHGEYVAPETRGALAVYTNRKSDRLARLARAGAITRRQQLAGYEFERVWCTVHGSLVAGRDSTIPPVGGIAHESDRQAERWAWANGKTRAVLNRAGPRAYSVLVSVAVFGEQMPRRVRPARDLRAALDACAVVLGVGG